MDVLKPSASLLCKLASIAVHIDEYFSPDGHELDREALSSLLSDNEVELWVAAMTEAGLAPRKRVQ